MTNQIQSVSVSNESVKSYHDYLTDAGSHASIAGLFISIWVLVNLRRIRSQFLFQARYPALKKAISGHAETINKHLSSFPNSESDLEIELHRCNSNLQNLNQKLTGTTKKTVTTLVKDINALPRPLSADCKARVRAIYVSLAGLEIDLENLTKDQKWSANN